MMRGRRATTGSRRRQAAFAAGKFVEGAEGLARRTQSEDAELQEQQAAGGVDRDRTQPGHTEEWTCIEDKPDERGEGEDDRSEE